MQQDVTSIPARRFVEVVRRWKPRPGSRAAHIRQKLINWDAALTANSTAAMLYEVWIAKLPPIVFGPRLGARTDLSLLLSTLEAKPNPQALEQALDEALSELERILGPDMNQWNWGRIHQIHFRHPLNEREFNRGPVARPGDAHTVNNTSGSGFRQTNGASWRQVVDVSDWDRSVMTNVPGESGDPSSPHYSDLIDEWASGRYHPMLYSRKAVESATVEKIVLKPR
jgi:penicillin amidase